MRVSNSLIASGNPSQTSSVTMAVWTQNIVRESFQVVVSSGSLNGTFALQASNDVAVGQEPYVFVPTNWTTIGTTSVIASTTALLSSYILGPIEASYEYTRLIYTTSSGSPALGLYNVRVKSLNGT